MCTPLDGVHGWHRSLVPVGVRPLDPRLRRFGPYYDVAEIALTHAGGRAAASVLTAEGWRVLLDGELSEAFLAVGKLVFSNDGKRAAYAAKRNAKAWFVHPERNLGPFEEVTHQSLTFSPDGASLAFVAKVGGRMRVWSNDTPRRGTFDDIRHLAFARASATLGFVGYDHGGAVVVVGDEIKGRYDDVSDLALSLDGRRFAAIACPCSSWMASSSVTTPWSAP